MKTTLILSLAVGAFGLTACDTLNSLAGSSPLASAAASAATPEQAATLVSNLTSTLNGIKTQYSSLKPLVDALVATSPAASSALKNAESMLAQATSSLNSLQAIRNDPVAVVTQAAGVQKDIAAAQQAVASVAAIANAAKTPAPVR